MFWFNRCRCQEGKCVSREVVQEIVDEAARQLSEHLTSPEGRKLLLDAADSDVAARFVAKGLYSLEAERALADVLERSFELKIQRSTGDL